ncbi:phosphatase PAP2 family protein [Polaribacter sargassicola]|uniref:phosphatase PAP2 family protein n=1 Tax=Polaribacter sargassicola TaxID=2836891 RepID=UPI001F2385A8|nr:phosphatase PAP2 family protein [Polaribacter sp. DS7-9]MCG1036279.1 phosphatase PAP2 family protein [Polaribacter sp. DS7-9]
MQQVILLNRRLSKKSSNKSSKKLLKIKDNLFLILSDIKQEIIIIYSLFFLVSLAFIMFFNKSTLHLKINQFHSSFFDVLFKYSTFLGDGVIFAILGVAFFFIKRKMTYVFLVSGVLTLLITHLFKKILFKGTLRPAAALGEENLHLIDGVKIAMMNSFPSGHTTTAFAIFTILCLYFAKCKSQYLWISLAIIAGFSRVYLSQHFLVDIFVGSFIGILIGITSMAIFSKPKSIY